MPDIIISYKNQKTLKILKELSIYIDFVVSVPRFKANQKSETFAINGVPIVRESDSFDNFNLDEMNEIFSRTNVDAKVLRSKWRRIK